MKTIIEETFYEYFGDVNSEELIKKCQKAVSKNLTKKYLKEDIKRKLQLAE